MNTRRAQPGWWQAVSAAAIALAVDALYLVIIWQEGEGELASGRVLFVAGCLAGAALGLVWGLALDGRTRSLLFTAAAALLAIFTILGSFSIGLLLAPAAVLAVLAATHVGSPSRTDSVLAALGAFLLVAVGLALT